MCVCVFVCVCVCVCVCMCVCVCVCVCVYFYLIHNFLQFKPLASQLFRNIVPHLKLDKDGSTSSLLENINHLKSVVEVSLWLY